MSIYIMTLGELAKKRGESVGDFVKKVQALGFEAGSHAKKLTQKDLDLVISLLDGVKESPRIEKKEKEKLKNPNVLMIKNSTGKRIVALVDAFIDDEGSIELKVVEQNTENSLGEALLEFRKKMGMHMGVN
jgi:hypothetical protein